MGIEYAHHLLVRDPLFTGDVTTARRVHAVLRRWRLVAGDPDLFALNGGRRRAWRGGLAAGGPANLLARYPGVGDGLAVAAVLGPSSYASVGDADRTLRGVSVVAGTDFRVGPVSESVFVEVVRPPLRSGVEVAPYPRGSHLWEFDDSYPADAATAPPETRVEAGRALPGFTGVWRAGVMLDCGKDLPRVGDDGLGLRATAAFVADLAAAFGTELVEVGRPY